MKRATLKVLMSCIIEQLLKRLQYLRKTSCTEERAKRMGFKAILLLCIGHRCSCALFRLHLNYVELYDLVGDIVIE